METQCEMEKYGWICKNQNLWEATKLLVANITNTSVVYSPWGQFSLSVLCTCAIFSHYFTSQSLLAAVQLVLLVLVGPQLCCFNELPPN